MSDIIIIMKLLFVPKQANEPKTKLSSQVALVVAGIFTIFALVQLFFFEDYIAFLSSFAELRGLGPVIGSIMASLTVLSIPFLLRMKLSDGFRCFSMVSGWLVGLYIILLTIYLNANKYNYDNDYSYVLQMISGSWMIFASIGLGVLIAWSSWGLWPKFKK